MPSQIQNIPAYRDLVLNELRRQAAIKGTETYKVSSYFRDYDKEIRDRLNRAQDCYKTIDEVLWYCYCYMPLHFDALQRVMELEETDANDKVYGDTFNRKIFNTDGDLLVIDVGCGPMTAGLALADWYNKSHSHPLKLSYTGIDDSQPCREFAERFAEYPGLFSMQNDTLFYANCNECDVKQLKTRVTNNGTLLFVFSYIFGQDSCVNEDWKGWATFMRQAMTACNAKHNIIVYLNSPPYPDKDNPGRWVDPNAKFADFCQSLGWRPPELQFKTGERYKYRQRWLTGFNEANGPRLSFPEWKPFRHYLVEATLVDENRIPVREDRKR